MEGALIGINSEKMGARLSVVALHLLMLFAFACSNECDRRITRRTFYSNEVKTVKIENYFGRVSVKKHSSESEVRVLVEVNLIGTLLHAANPPIVFSDNGEQALVMVGPLAEGSSSTQPSLFSTWMLSLPLVGALMFQRRAFVLVLLMLFSIWISVTVAQDGMDDCLTGDVEVFMPRNSCFSVTDNQDGRTTSINIVDCEVANRPQVVSCSISRFLYPNCTEGSTGITLSWNVMFSDPTINTLPVSDIPILIEWRLMPVNCPTCPMVTSFTTVLELHEVADIRNFQSWSKILPPDDLPLTNGSAVTFLLRVDTPREGYSMSRECDAPDGSNVFTNTILFNPGPLTGQLSFNTTTFNAHQPVAVMAASEVCFLLRGFENGVCSITSYRASLGTAMCGSDSINFTTLQTYRNNSNLVQACLRNDGDLDIGRYFVTIEAMDYTNLSTVVCPNVSFVIDNVRPQFVSVNQTCFTTTQNNFEEQLSWDIQALSDIVAIRYNISNTQLSNPQDFIPFPMPVEPNELNYNIQPLLQDHMGNMQYLTLQAESGVGLTETHTVRADTICSNK